MDRHALSHLCLLTIFFLPQLSFVFMAIYFSLLEVLPMAVVLFYYRRVPAPMDYSVFEDSNQQGLLVADDDLMEPAGGKAGLA